MADGVWQLQDDGSFDLFEPYKTQLVEARIEATRGWVDGLIGYLAPRCPYTTDQLSDELFKRSNGSTQDASHLFNEFVLEALSGDL